MSFRSRYRPYLLSSAAALLSTPVLAAPDTPGPSAAASPAAAAPDPASDPVRRGDTARQAGRWAEAAAAYRDVLAGGYGSTLPVVKRAEVAGELGLCELTLGEHRNAAEHLQLSLEQRDALSPAQQRRYEAGQKLAEREVGTLFIGVRPRDAEVLLDGRSFGAPRPTYMVFVTPGPHTVRAKLAGHGDALAAVEATRGSSSSVTLELGHPPLAPATAPQASRASLGAMHSPSTGAANEVLRTIGFATASAGVVCGVGLWIASAMIDGLVDERAKELHQRTGTWGSCNSTRYLAECKQQEALIARRDGVGDTATGILIASGTLGAFTLLSYQWAPDASPPRTFGVRPVAAGAAGVTPGLTIEGRW